MKNVLKILKRYFVSGVLIVVPIILTYIVLKFLFETVDSILKPILLQLLGYYVYGLGVLTTLLIIILAGILTRNIIGSKIHSLGEKILIRLPLIRPIYSSAKQLLEAVTLPQMNAFKEVVIVEYPRKGVYSLCFVSNKIVSDIVGTEQEYISVFIPSTPTPISGMVILLPVDEVYPVDMSIEEGVKFLVSGGVVSPEMINKKIV